MLEVTVKTLDSQNHSFSVPEESTVREFKEQISPVLNISVDKQRLIFCGKVLKDDKKLNEYDVNGKVIHVVQSLPPQGNNASTSSTSTTSSGSSNTTNSGPRVAHRDAAGFVLGAFTIPQDFLDTNQMQNIVQEVVSGMGDIGRNATIISRSSEEGGGGGGSPSTDLRIRRGEAQIRMNRVQTMLHCANRLLDSLENSGSGNNSSESSSQTDDNEEFRNRLMEAEISHVIRGESSGVSVSADSASSDTDGESTSRNTTTVTDRFGLEGLAQVAQAALTAAIATATAAARAATSTMNSQEASTNETAATTESRTDGSEPTVTVESTTGEFMDPENIALLASDTTQMVIDTESATTTDINELLPSSSSKTESDASTADAPTATTAGQSSSRDADTAASGSASSREPQRPSVQALANLLDEVIRVNRRLEPSLEKYRDLVRNDAALSVRELIDATRLYSKTSQLLHFLSHAYHSLSDFFINFAARPPRSPRVRICSSSPAVFQHGIPLQAQINISSSVIPSSSGSSTTTSAGSNTATSASSTTTTTNTQNTTSEASSRPSVANPPRTRSGNLPRVPSDSSIPSMMRNQNPMFFMEVTPGSITIDSISTSVDPSTGTSDLSDDDDGIIINCPRDSSTVGGTSASSASQSETRTETQATNTQTSSTRTSTSTPMPTFSRQGPTMMAPLRHLIPVPLTSMGSVQTFDPALPCHSMWALEPLRRRHNASGTRNGQTAQQRSAQSNQGTTQATSQSRTVLVTPNAPGHPEDIFSSFYSNVHNHSHPINQALTMLTNVALRDSRSNRSENRNQGNRERSTRVRIPNPAAAHHMSAFADNLPVMVDQTLYDLIDGVRASASIPEDFTVAEFVYGTRTMSYPQSNIVQNAFLFLANQLPIEDVFEIALGNYQAINRLKEPLQKYVREKIFPPENTEEENNAVVERIIANFDEIMEPFVRQLIARPNINFRETMHNFFRHNINVLRNALQSPIPDSVEFGNFICSLCLSIILEFQFLHNTCIHEGNHALQHYANEIITDLCYQMIPPFRLALLCMASKLITRDPLPHIDVAVARGHIAYKNSKYSSKSNSSNESKTEQGTSASSRLSTDKKERPSENSSDALRAVEREAAPTLSAIARIVEQTSLRNSVRSSENRSSASNLTEVMIGSETWHSSLPRDWVPIIARDVQRQRRQAPQSPFSDAYLSGMPSKRRKIMTNGGQALLAHSQTTLTDMLQQAISSANVKPVSSSEEIKRDVSQDLQLQGAFTLHMKNAVQERLEKDMDYCSEKFPNARKYYNINHI